LHFIDIKLNVDLTSTFVAFEDIITRNNEVTIELDLDCRIFAATEES
jgi:hypothetical protein